jgi:hypothetical protein
MSVYGTKVMGVIFSDIIGVALEPGASNQVRGSRVSWGSVISSFCGDNCRGLGIRRGSVKHLHLHTQNRRKMIGPVTLILASNHLSSAITRNATCLYSTLGPWYTQSAMSQHVHPWNNPTNQTDFLTSPSPPSLPSPRYPLHLDSPSTSKPPIPSFRIV